MVSVSSQREASGGSIGRRRAIWRLLAACGANIFDGCTVIVLANMLAPATFGIYIFVLWLATAAVPAVGVGMSALSSRYVAEIRGREAARRAAGIFYFVWRRQYRTILLYCALYLALVFPFSRLFRASVPATGLLLAGLVAPPMLLNGVAGVTLRSLRRFDTLAALRLFEAGALLLCILGATQMRGAQTALFLLAPAAASTLTLILALIYIVRLLPLQQALPMGTLWQERFTRGLSNSLPLFVLDVIVWKPCGLLALAFWHPGSELAFFGLAALISARIMEGMPLLLTCCVLPLLLRYVPGQHFTNAHDAFIKMSRTMALLAFPFCAAICIACPWLITFCFGPAYLPLVTPLRLLLLPAALGSVATVSLTHLANSDNRRARRAQVRFGMLVAGVHICLLLPATLFWGATGTALAAALAQTLSAAGSILLCKKYLKV